MKADASPVSRRTWLLGTLSTTALVACGGGGGSGGDPAPPPAPPAFGQRLTPLANGLAVSYHQALRAADGSVLVLGGSRGTGALSTAIDRFDPASRGFTEIGQLLTGRAGHSAIRLAGGQILVAGGQTGTNDAPFAELVDERTGDVQQAGAMQQPRQRHAATLLADGRVLVTGGINRRTAELWDPATGQWRLAAGSMAHTRELHTATLLASGRVLITGGWTPVQDYVFAELFDPVTESFTPLPGGPAQRLVFHEAVRAADGSVLLFGGEVMGDETAVPSARVWRFDPAARSFTAERPLTLPRSLMRAVQRQDEVLLIGGETRPGSASSVAWSEDAERPLAPLPAARWWHTATLLLDGTVLVVGGEDPDGTYQPTVIYA